MSDSGFGFDSAFSSGSRALPTLNEAANQIGLPEGMNFGPWERECQQAAWMGFHDPPSLVHPSVLGDAQPTLTSLVPLIERGDSTFTTAYLAYLYRVSKVKDASDRGRQLFQDAFVEGAFPESHQGTSPFVGGSGVGLSGFGGNSGQGMARSTPRPQVLTFDADGPSIQPSQQPPLSQAEGAAGPSEATEPQPEPTDPLPPSWKPQAKKEPQA